MSETTSGGLLAGRRGLIFGVANARSLAWAIAERAHAEGATLALNYGSERLARRVQPLAESIGAAHVGLCDVTDDAQLETWFAEAIAALGGSVDFLVHSVAFAPSADLKGDFVDVSRTGFAHALSVSAYSLLEITRRALPHMTPGASVLTLSYLGAERAMPGYNLMGVAKAALESTVRYLAAELGPQGIRVNALRPGPVRTLAASGVPGFKAKAAYASRTAPLRRAVGAEEVAGTAMSLLSDLGSAITGEIIHVDAGFHAVGAPPLSALGVLPES
ncbi:MAG: enoyl-ACP reductase [Bradymonadia bacterium]